jgi:hypothetical protein
VESSANIRFEKRQRLCGNSRSAADHAQQKNGSNNMGGTTKCAPGGNLTECSVLRFKTKTQTQGRTHSGK